MEQALVFEIIICDGKCGLGRQIPGGKYLCPHNCLATTHPKIAAEWHPTLNGVKTARDYFAGSHAKVWWKCKSNPCGCHAWESTIDNRSRKGNGCPYCSRKRLCIHNSLYGEYPVIASEWDHEKNTFPSWDISSGSTVVCWWKCKSNSCGCHVWPESPSNRTRKGYGCPYCVNQQICVHNSLYGQYPKIASQWDSERNGINPWEVSPRTDKLYHWICPENPCGCHRYQASPDNRIGKGAGCPYCCGKKTCPHNSLYAVCPEIALDWDFRKNEDKPWEIAPGSNEVRWWKCHKDPCGCHEWQTTVNNRTKGNTTGCPFCSDPPKRFCPHNSLQSAYPKVAAQWDYEKNVEDTPWTIAPASNKMRSWICPENPCGCHKWECPVSDRTVGSQGCPYCSNRRVCPHSNLLARCPEIASEWDYIKNTDRPESLVPGSGQRRWWICKLNPEHKWRRDLYARTVAGSGCPICHPAKGCSKAQIDWIRQIEMEQKIQIRCAMSPEGEFKIPEVGKVDGYCKETNTVYEYHGDYWHGNPNVFEQEAMNTTVHKTFGTLYEKTIQRDQKIRSLGFNLVVKWETPVE